MKMSRSIFARDMNVVHLRAKGGDISNSIRFLSKTVLFGSLVCSAVFLPAAVAAEAAQSDGPPLPVHTIEGGGGAAITPIAYLVNPGPEGTQFGLPAVSYTYLNLEDKDLQTFSVTSTLFRRLEIGYAAGLLDLGTLPRDILSATGVAITDELIVHNVSARLLAVQENQFGPLTPALTFTAHYKYNDEIDDIDQDLGGVLSTLGYDSNDGVDFLVTATKAWPNFFGQTLITTLGLRFSEAIWNGYLGFADDYKVTAEANAVLLLPHNFFLAYEYRGMPDAIDELGTLVRDETDWHAADLGWIANDHLSLVLFYGHVGNLVNADDVNTAWALQAKFEF